MIISDEQVRKAVGYLRAVGRGAPALPERTREAPEFIERVRRQIAEEPETREDRVAEARDALSGAGFDSGDVAAKMIGRAISDSLR